MLKMLENLLNEESGQDLVEYASARYVHFDFRRSDPSASRHQSQHLFQQNRRASYLTTLSHRTWLFPQLDFGTTEPAGTLSYKLATLSR